MYPSGAGSGGSCTSVGGEGIWELCTFSLKFAVNLKISLFKKKKERKTQSNECSLGKRWYTFEVLSARTAYGKRIV